MNSNGEYFEMWKSNFEIIKKKNSLGSGKEQRFYRCVEIVAIVYDGTIVEKNIS